MSNTRREGEIKGQRVWQDTAAGTNTSDQDYGDFGLQINLQDQRQDFLAQVSLYIPDFHSEPEGDTFLGIFLDDKETLLRGVVRTGSLNR